MSNRLNWFFASAIASLTLAACGGGANETTTLSGAVIDGYIKNAKVCLDVNSNLTCDANEPTATTDADGGYSLTYSGSTAGMHVLAVVTTESFDSDLGPITKPFDLLTPAEEPSVVSPLTTLVSSDMLTSKTSLSDARATVTATLGKDPIGYDFKDANDDDTLAVAQVTAAAMAQVKETIAADTDGAKLTPAQAIKAAVQEVKTAVLPAVLTTDGKINFDMSNSTSQADVLSKVSATVDVEAVVQGRIQQIVKSASLGEGSLQDLEQLFKSTGLIIITEEATELEDGTGGYNVVDTIRVEHVLYHPDTAIYGLEDNNGSPKWTKAYEWSNTQTYFDGTAWKQTLATQGNDQFVEFTGGNCVLMLSEEGSKVGQKVCAVAKDLSGKKIADIVVNICEEDTPNPECNPDAVFPAGSWGADLTFSQIDDHYRLWVSDDWGGYDPNMADFSTNLMTNQHGYLVGTACKFSMEYVPKSGNQGELNQPGSTGEVKWTMNNGDCQSQTLSTNDADTEKTSFKVTQVGGQPVFEVFVPNIYRKEYPGDRDLIWIFTEGKNANGVRGVFQGIKIPAGTKQTIEFTGDPSESMQVLSIAAFEAISDEVGLPTFPYLTKQ